MRLIYSDGSCFDCSLLGTDPAFGTQSQTLTTVRGGFLHHGSTDGLRDHVLYRGLITDAVTSSQGRLALVRRGRVLVPTGGRLVVVGAGSSPSWSPDGSRLAFVHHGWIEIVYPRRRRTVRLARGSSPAWAPDGHAIAYIAGGQSVRVIAPFGGNSRPVGRLRGRSVDWQPIATNLPPPCTPLAGTSVAANSAAATLTQDPAHAAPNVPSALLGCLFAEGHQRLLTSFNGGGGDNVQAGFTDAALAGDYAAVITYTDFKANFNALVGVFNLRTGAAVPSLGAEPLPDGPVTDGLVLNRQGFTAVHTNFNGTEQIIASDSTGAHVLDTIQPSGSTPALTNLALKDNTLTWHHNGEPESAMLGLGSRPRVTGVLARDEAPRRRSAGSDSGDVAASRQLASNLSQDLS